MNAAATILAAMCAALLFAGCDHAHPARSAEQDRQWEYKIVAASAWVHELMLKLKTEEGYDLDVTEERYAYDFEDAMKVAPHEVAFYEEKLNQLGAEGWRLVSPFKPDHTASMLFMRPKP